MAWNGIPPGMQYDDIRGWHYESERTYATTYTYTAPGPWAPLPAVECDCQFCRALFGER